MKYIYLKTFFLLMFISTLTVSIAQNNHNHKDNGHVQGKTCFSDEINKAYLDKMNLHEYAKQIRLETQAIADQRKLNKSTSAIRTVAIVVHVINNPNNTNDPYVSDGAIYSMIDILNEDFTRTNADATDTRAIFTGVADDAEINFCLALVDPNGAATTGIVRVSTTEDYYDVNTEADEMKFADGAPVTSGTGTTGSGDPAWDTNTYLNIWIANITNGAGSGTAGYAYLPISAGGAHDGLVLDADIGIGIVYGQPSRTATHEIGHYFGLLHTWGDGTMTCANDDGHADTPESSDNNMSVSNCSPTTPPNSCNAGAPGDLPDQYENYMSYASCQNMFSADQTNFMNGTLDGVRSTLLGNNYCSTINADFTANITTVTAGNSVVFTDASNSMSTITSWAWSFTGGSPSTKNTQGPHIITYSSPGLYTVSLTISDGTSVNTETKTQYINVLMPTTLTANFQANQTTILAGTTIDFTDLSLNGPTSWDWVFNGAATTTSTTQHPTGIQYDNIGDYTVELSVSDGTINDSEIKIDYIHVVDSSNLPEADFISDYTVIPAGTAINFTNLSSGTISSVQWTFTGSNTPTSTDYDPILIQYNTVGNYTVSLEVYNPIGADTLTKVAYIHVIDPTLYDTLHCGFQAISSRLIVAGDVVNFEDLTSGFPTDWYWEFDGAVTPTSSVQNPQGIAYNVPGFYEVRLMVTNGLFSDSVAKYQYIVVTDFPWPNPNGYCDTVTNIQSNEITIVPRHLGNSEWGYFPGHNSYNVTFYADRYVNYTFSSVSALFVPPSTIFSSDSEAKVKFVIWDADSITGLPGQELVSKQKNISSFTPNVYHSIEFDTPVEVNGIFYVGFQVFYDTPMDTFSVYMVENRGPNQPNTLYVKQGYDWHTPSQLLQDTLNTSLAIKVVGCLVNIEDELIDDNLVVYPNPTNGNVNLSFGDDVFIKNIDVKVYDLLGKQLNIGLNKNYSNNYEFNINNSPTGIYILNVRVNNSIITRKISVIK